MKNEVVADRMENRGAAYNRWMQGSRRELQESSIAAYSGNRGVEERNSMQDRRQELQESSIAAFSGNRGAEERNSMQDRRLERETPIMEDSFEEIDDRGSASGDVAAHEEVPMLESQSDPVYVEEEEETETRELFGLVLFYFLFSFFHCFYTSGPQRNPFILEGFIHLLFQLASFLLIGIWVTGLPLLQKELQPKRSFT